MDNVSNYVDFIRALESVPFEDECGQFDEEAWIFAEEENRSLREAGWN